MKEIGKKLQEKRIAAGLDIEDVSAKTRLTAKHIKALEDGDISFFHDDLSYLRFFVKSYCEVVALPFDEVKDELRQSIEGYTTGFVLEKQNAQDQTNRSIVTNIKENHPKVSVGTPDSGRKKMHVDGSFISLVAVFIGVALILAAAFFMWTGSDKGDSQPPVNDQPIADVENGNDKADQNQNADKPQTDTQTDAKEEPKDMVIRMESPTVYTLENVKAGDTLKIETTFNGSSSGYSLTINGKEVKEEGVYNYQQTAKSEIKVEKGMKISLYIGCMVNVDIKINGEVVKTDGSINPSTFPGVCPSQTIDFKIGE